VEIFKTKVAHCFGFVSHFGLLPLNAKKLFYSFYEFGIKFSTNPP